MINTRVSRDYAGHGSPIHRPCFDHCREIENPGVLLPEITIVEIVIIDDGKIRWKGYTPPPIVSLRAPA